MSGSEESFAWGGARAGAGRKSLLDQGERVSARLDKVTRETLTAMGDGKLSIGLRIALESSTKFMVARSQMSEKLRSTNKEER
ncbi:hypothetical protein D3C87_1375310 [compost metagenome]